MDVEQKRHLAEQARELKDDPAFVAAILALRKQWFGQLMEMRDRDSMEVMTLRLQVLETIPQQLQIFMNDYAMAKARSR